MRLWESSPHTDIILLALPVQVKLDEAIAQSNVKHAHIEQRGYTTICGRQRAFFARMQGDSSTGGTGTPVRSEVQLLATNVKGKTYLAIYIRPLRSPADPAAERAIRNVCPK